MDPLITDRHRQIVERIQVNDLGFGYDAFGLNKDVLVRAIAVLEPIFENYFRVETFGLENIPATGRTILAANHTGALPLDGAMVGLSVALRKDPPRLIRAVYDNFVGAMPFVNLLFSRMGQVLGTRENFEYLLDNDEMVVVFPEGSKGIVKPYFSEAYKCRKWNIGFIELHLKYRAPLIPVAVVGAEEQLPILQENKWIGKPMGVPEVPITVNTLLAATTMLPGLALPFPARYRIYYGEPIEFYKEFSPAAIRSPDLVRELAREVQTRVQRMIIKGLEDRPGIYY